ncbi:MAG: Holliday junction resolvase RuvX [Chloroflexota bacterium]
MSSPLGRIMALDLGEKRIGIALSDPLRMIAKADRVIKRRSRKEDYAIYRRIIEESSVTLVLVGLPLLLDGEDSQQTKWVRNYSEQLASEIAVPLELWDEGFSTVEAEEALKLGGVRRKKLRDRVDAVAAAVILQSYLDAKR